MKNPRETPNNPQQPNDPEIPQTPVKHPNNPKDNPIAEIIAGMFRKI